MDGDARDASASQPQRRVRTHPDVAAWVLLIAFVCLVLSVIIPAATEGGGADLGAALLFMLGLTAGLAGSGIALAASNRRWVTALGALALVAGLMLLYGLVPSLVALSVVLLGVALQISSLPAAD